MRKNNDKEVGEQRSKFKETIGQNYTPFDVKAELILTHMDKMPLTDEQKKLVVRWINENYTHYVNKAYDYAMLVSIESHKTIKGKLCLNSLVKSFKAYEQEKQTHNMPCR